MKSKYLYYLLIFIFVLFFSCAKKESESDSKSSTTELEGTWKTSCIDFSDGTYRIVSAVISGTDVTVRYEWHNDSGCNTDYSLWEDKYDSLSIGDAVTFESGATGHKATANVKSFTLKPQSSTLVSLLNSTNYCGNSDWQLNVTKDYTGKTCSSTTFDVTNTTYYFMYRLSGNNLNMSSLQKSTYPSTVSTTITYVKQ